MEQTIRRTPFATTCRAGAVSTRTVIALCLLTLLIGYVSGAARAATVKGPDMAQIPDGCIVVARAGGGSGRTCVSSYALAIHEVTVDAFRRFVFLVRCLLGWIAMCDCQLP